MPELPEVETIRKVISGEVVGHQIQAVEVFAPEIIRQGDVQSLEHRRITNVKRHGKYLWFELEDNVRLFVHFGMSGLFLWRRAGEYDRSHIRALIRFDRGTLLYKDVRKLQGWWILTDGATPWRRLGKDALDPSLTVKALVDILRKQRRAIKNVLIDQSSIAGIGNIYASEILYASGILPHRPANSLDEMEVARLLKAIRNVLVMAIRACGTTLRDYKLSDGRDANFQNFLLVYGKEGKPCPRCGSPIQRITQAQRSSYFCPNHQCQK